MQDKKKAQVNNITELYVLRGRYEIHNKRKTYGQHESHKRHTKYAGMLWDLYIVLL